MSSVCLPIVSRYILARYHKQFTGLLSRFFCYFGIFIYGYQLNFGNFH